MNDEIWRPNPSFPLYLISSHGRVKRAIARGHGQRVGRIMKPLFRPRSGYIEYSLTDADGRKLFVRANRLICETFHYAPPSENHHAAHWNGDKTDNRAENLYWATAKQNEKDKIRHGTRNGRLGTEQ